MVLARFHAEAIERIMKSSASALVASTGWLSDLMLGHAATAAAVIAIAVLGLLILTGRLPTRRGAAVIFGCFVLFSAREIAFALVGQAGATSTAIEAEQPTSLPYTPVMPKPQPYDPYAGASVPAQREPPIIQQR